MRDGDCRSVTAGPDSQFRIDSLEAKSEYTVRSVLSSPPLLVDLVSSQQLYGWENVGLMLRTFYFKFLIVKFELCARAWSPNKFSSGGRGHILLFCYFAGFASIFNVFLT